MQAGITQQLKDMTHDNGEHFLLMHEGVSKQYCALKELKVKTLKSTDVGQSNTAMRHLTTGICSEKRIVRQFCRGVNVTECTYTKLDSTV